MGNPHRQHPQQLGFTSCHHEPCLYVKTDSIDDFAVSARSKEIAEQVIKAINSKLSIDI